MKNKPYFPMFIDLSDKNIVVVGGGNIATRRVKTLLSFTRNIRVIAPKVTMEMMELGKAGYVELITRPVKRTDFAMAVRFLFPGNLYGRGTGGGNHSQWSGPQKSAQDKRRDSECPGESCAGR